MANVTEEEISNSLVTILSEVSDIGVVIGDRRFTEDKEDELLTLIESQNDDGAAKGCLITFEEVTQQADESICQVVALYRYELSFIYPYQNDSGADTSEVKFKRVLFGADDLLNQNRNLRLGNLIRHQCLQSNGPLDVINWAPVSARRLTHAKTFDLIVEVAKLYDQEQD